jgi:hypothetical protein
VTDNVTILVDNHWTKAGAGYAVDNYWWRVVAANENGENTSLVWAFEIVLPTPIVPTQPQLHLPADGTKTTDNTPYFEWTVGENADNHRLLVDNDSGFTSPEENEVLVDNHYTVTTQLIDDNYSWKVIAVNENGENESVVWTFIVDTAAPTAPTLVWPDDEDEIWDNTPNLNWNAVSDASTPVLYRCWVDDDSGFPSPNYDSGWVSDDNYQLGTELAEDTWYWRVGARDNVGNIGDNSSSREFDVALPSYSGYRFYMTPDGINNKAYFNDNESDVNSYSATTIEFNTDNYVAVESDDGTWTRYALGGMWGIVYKYAGIHFTFDLSDYEDELYEITYTINYYLANPAPDPGVLHYEDSGWVNDNNSIGAGEGTWSETFTENFSDLLDGSGLFHVSVKGKSTATPQDIVRVDYVRLEITLVRYRAYIRWEDNYELVNNVLAENLVLKYHKIGGGVEEISVTSNPENVGNPIEAELLEIWHNEAYHRARIPSENVINFFIVDNPAELGEYIFELQDLTGDYGPDENGWVSFRKYIGDNLAVIAGDYWGSNYKASFHLTLGDSLHVRIGSTEGEREIGPVRLPSTASEETIVVTSAVDFEDPTYLHDYITVDAWFLTSTSIRVSYQDNYEGTDNVTVTIYDENDNVVYTAVFTSDTFTTTWAGASENGDYTIILTIYHDVFGYSPVELSVLGVEITAPPFTGAIPGLDALGDAPFTWASLAGLLFIIVVGFTFGPRHAGFGMMALGFFLLLASNHVMGLFSVPLELIAFIVTIGVLMIIVSRGGQY